jgi:DNA mismatch repair protein MutS2
MEGQDELHNGDNVRMHGQECIGEVVRITARYATVAFKSMELNIPLRQLEKAQLTTQARLSNLPSQPITRVINLMNLANEEFSSFDPEIDLHGMSVSSALSALDRWIDKASLLGHKQLKIIHGKGTGTLRNAVRTYLKSHDQVKRVIDKHPYPGGEGVTWLQLD